MEVKTLSYKLLTPLFGWAKGETLTFEPQWNTWIRKKTGESFDLRGSIGEGEVVIALNFLADMHTFLKSNEGDK